MFPPKPQKLSASAARLLGSFSMSAQLVPINGMDTKRLKVQNQFATEF